MINLYQTKKIIVVIACLAFVGACAHVKLTTAWAMRDVDLLTVNPGVMRLALVLPRHARFSSVTVTMKFTRGGKVLINDEFKLETITDGPEIKKPGLPEQLDNLIVLRVPNSKIDNMVNFQTEYMLEVAEPRGSQASFGIDSKLEPDWINEYCDSGKQDLKISAWVLVDEQQGYLPLLKDSQIGRLLNAQSDNVCLQHTARVGNDIQQLATR
jgi:hypothetical protein